MNSSVEDIIKQIPDFEEFLKLADQIRDLSFQKLLLEKEIKEMESNVFKSVTTDQKYLVGGKTPAISYIENTYKHTGLDGEILPLREQYARVNSDLERAKLQLDIYKQMVGIFQTVSANERGAGF